MPSSDDGLVDVLRMSSASVANGKAANIGVVGGGQLAQMLVQAANLRHVSVIVQSGSADDPAVDGATRHVVADPVDVEGTKKLVQDCQCITFENEWVNIDALIPLAQQGVKFRPSLAALAPLVDKISQRQLLSDLGVPGPEWTPLTAIPTGVPRLPAGWSFPVMAKAARGGYDGKGTRVLNSIDDLAQLLRSVDASKWLLESWVRFERELALVASRDATGQVRCLPLVETHQTNQVCDWVIAPAVVEHAVEAMAYNVVASLLTKLDYQGVLAIEFFYGPAGLQVNEIAPRTHNSAHFSIEACSSSQFDQQLCIASDLSVPAPALISAGALMVNLLGLPKGRASSIEQRLSELRRCDGFHVHWYGKELETPGRKLGHVTVLLRGVDAVSRDQEAAMILERVRAIWPQHLANSD